MKKKLWLLSALLIVSLLAICMTFSVSANDVIRSGTWGSLSWTLNETSGELVIFGNGEMKSLADSPVWLSYSDKIKNVVIKDGVTSIGNHAFKDCKNLSSITIPDSVTSIGYLSFLRCNNLTEITIPNTCADVSDDAFFGCENIATAKVPSKAIRALPNRGLKHLVITKGSSIPNGACQNKNSLVSIILPDEITEIGSRAFCGCSNLKSIFLPEGVTKIGDQAFQNCQSLESIKIPDTVINIGNDAFLDCKKLRSVVLPQSLTNIGDFAFSGCESLASFSIPKKVKRIGESAFWGCKNISEIILPNGVKEIGDFAFADCTGLKKVVIPNTIETISGYAFDSSFNIETALMPISVISCIPKNNLKTVVFTSGTNIPNQAFQNCRFLQKVIFCGTENEWQSLQKNKSWLNNLKNTKFLYHDFKWEITDAMHKATCSYCKVTEQSEHTWDKGKVTTKPTHLETGIKTYSCVVCARKQTTIIEKDSKHSSGDWTEYDETQHKKVCECGEIVYENHKYGSWTVVTPSTENNEGQQQKVCVCGHKINEVIPVLKHQYHTTIVNPTCTEQGYTTHTCENCNDTYRDEYIASLGHIYDNDQDPSCNKCNEIRVISANNQQTLEDEEGRSGIVLAIGISAISLIVVVVVVFVYKNKK